MHVADPTGQGPQLVLDGLTPADAPRFAEIVRHPEVGRMLFIFGPDYSTADAAALIARQSNPASRPLRLAIRRAHGAPMIGTIGVGEGAAPDIFYFLDPAEAGQGVMRTALDLFLPFVARQFGLGTLGAKVFTDNPASAHLLEAQGFAREGLGEVHSAARTAPAPVWLYRRKF